MDQILLIPIFYMLCITYSLMVFTTPIVYKEKFIITDIDLVREGDPEGTKYESVVHCTTDGEFIMYQRVKSLPSDETLSNTYMNVDPHTSKLINFETDSDTCTPLIGVQIEDISPVSNQPYLKECEDKFNDLMCLTDFDAPTYNTMYDTVNFQLESTLYLVIIILIVFYQVSVSLLSSYCKFLNFCKSYFHFIK